MATGLVRLMRSHQDRSSRLFNIETSEIVIIKSAFRWRDCRLRQPGWRGRAIDPMRQVQALEIGRRRNAIWMLKRRCRSRWKATAM